MNIKARRIEGSSHTANDLIEVKITYDEAASHCVMKPVVISGPDVTHGGGANSNTYIHYKNHDRDTDSDGVVDYSSATMIIEQVEKGTSVVRIEAEMAPLAAYQAYVTAYQQWDDDYVSRTIDEFGDLQTTIADGAPAEPQAPAPWVEQSGEITLEWFDDNFV